MFTLLMVDPDVPPEYRLATNERPLLKWLVTNIADGQFDRGDVIVDYVPVAPPTDALTPYYFLLFEQRGQLPRFTFGDFSDPDCRDDRWAFCNFFPFSLIIFRRKDAIMANSSVVCNNG